MQINVILHSTPRAPKFLLDFTFSNYYDVSNQRDATTFSFINLFNLALHVSGDKFTHPQELFLTVYTAFGTMHRSAAVSVHCAKSCIYSQKELLKMGEIFVRNM
jgi:hypothetical protein